MVIITPTTITASYLITTNIKETCPIKVMYKEVDKKSEKNKF
jgi:hypothetical protein